jgi:hypothetical protein
MDEKDDQIAHHRILAERESGKSQRIMCQITIHQPHLLGVLHAAIPLQTERRSIKKIFGTPIGR